MRMTKTRALRVLDFDVECRPLAWYGGDWVTKQPTAIAWCWIGDDVVKVEVIGESDRSSRVPLEEARMLEAFRRAYDEADIVTGHFIRGFDLPLLNGALMRLGRRGLDPKMTQDTKLDLVRAQGLSKSQENLGAMFDLVSPKVGMDTTKWAEANMLLPEGIRHTRERVVGDVIQHMELRALMIDEGLLRPPVVWSPGAGHGKRYAP